jgi:hypothetical protein
MLRAIVDAGRILKTGTFLIGLMPRYGFLSREVPPRFLLSSRMPLSMNCTRS